MLSPRLKEQWTGTLVTAMVVVPAWRRRRATAVSCLDVPCHHQQVRSQRVPLLEVWRGSFKHAECSACFEQNEILTSMFVLTAWLVHNESAAMQSYAKPSSLPSSLTQVTASISALCRSRLSRSLLCSNA